MESIDHDKLFEQAEALCLLAAEDAGLLDDYRVAAAAARSLENQGWKRTTGMTQHHKILKHLRRAGSITVREALVEYSIASLTKRIQELRALGYEIVSTTKHHPITQQRYVRYSFPK